MSASLGGSRWVNSQTGGWLDGSCQCVSVAVNPDKATDTSKTEKSFPSLDREYVSSPPSGALGEKTLGQLPGEKI